MKGPRKERPHTSDTDRQTDRRDSRQTDRPIRASMPPSFPLGDVSSLVRDAGGLPHCFPFELKIVKQVPGGDRKTCKGRDRGGSGGARGSGARASRTRRAQVAGASRPRPGRLAKGEGPTGAIARRLPGVRGALASCRPWRRVGLRVGAVCSHSRESCSQSEPRAAASGNRRAQVGAASGEWERPPAVAF